MSVSPHELSAAPAAALLAVVGLAAVIRGLRRRGGLTAPRVLVGVALCVYAIGIVVNSAFPIYLGTSNPGVSWTVYLNLVPLQGTEVADAARNVLVFAPLGVLLPLVLPIRSTLGLIAHAFLLSLSIEVLQLVNALTGHGGHIADVNDLLANTVGALVGYVVVRSSLRFAASRRILAALSWPTAGLLADRDEDPADAHRDRRPRRVDHEIGDATRSPSESGDAGTP